MSSFLSPEPAFLVFTAIHTIQSPPPPTIHAHSSSSHPSPTYTFFANICIHPRRRNRRLFDMDATKCYRHYVRDVHSTSYLSLTLREPWMTSSNVSVIYTPHRKPASSVTTRRPLRHVHYPCHSWLPIIMHDVVNSHPTNETSLQRSLV